jgi:hypothetical protein
MNCNFSFSCFLFTTDLKKFFGKIMIAEEVFVNFYNFNHITYRDSSVRWFFGLNCPLLFG